MGRTGWGAQAVRRGTRVSGGVAAWTPAQLDAQLWLRADLGITLDGSDNVSAWANQGTSGSDLDFSQSVSADRLDYNSSDANFSGAATVEGDGTEALELAAASTALDIGDADDAVFLAVFRDTTVSGWTSVIGIPVGDGDGEIQLQTRTSSGCRFRFDPDGAAAVDKAAGPDATQNAVGVICGCKTGAASGTDDDYECALDGTAGVTVSADYGAISPGANSLKWQVAGDSYTGQIAEIIARVGPGARWSAAEEALLVSYLNARYGLALTGV